MTDLNSTLLSILLILGSVLIVVIMYFVFRMSKTISALQHEVTTLNMSIAPLLERITHLTDSTHTAMEMITEYRDAIGVTIENFRKLSRNVLRLEEILQRQVEPSVVGLASVIGSMRKGIQSFSESWRRSH